MRYYYIFLCLLMIPLSSFGDESVYPFSDHVAALWAQGKDGMHEVKKIADDRLADNPDDIVGLLLAFEYQVEYLQVNKFESLGKRIISSGKNIKNKRFSHYFGTVENSINMLLLLKDNVPEKMLEEDRKLIGLPGKSLTDIDIIRVCEEEGLVSMADLEERKASKYYWAAIPVVLLLIGFAVYLRRRGQKVEDASA
ncbi:hypothetical protein JYT55_01395 [Mariprofundus ferrooxydans]|nr:hypothetical protein [Mariprofundus ferrooxydans]